MKPPAACASRVRLDRKDLDRHFPLQVLLPGPIDDPHAASAEHAADRTAGDDRRSVDRHAAADDGAHRIAERGIEAAQQVGPAAQFDRLFGIAGFAGM